MSRFDPTSSSTYNRGVQSNASSAARFMSGVYYWLTLGVIVTGSVAYGVGSSPQILGSLFSIPFFFPLLVILQLGSVVFLSLAIRKISSLTASLVYLFYAALTGLTFSTLFVVYLHESIFQVFWLTASSFAGLSAFGFFTKRDLGPVGSFCIMGLFGMMGFALLSLFMPSMMGGAASTTYSIVGVIVFSGLTAYDSQKIKSMAVLGDSEEGRKGTVFGALTLYLDFVNLFLMLLRLLGRRK